MRLSVRIFIFISVFVLAAGAQTGTKDILLPTGADFSEAQIQGVEVFKILPRGIFDYEKNELQVRGGGAYYSFVKKSHSYNEIPQIQLERDVLSVGFYGANYGFIADLGDVPLSDINRESQFTEFLYNYEPKKYETEAREEYRNTGKGFEKSGLRYNQRQAAVAGHTYILRAISYDEADALIAFKIHRRDADGSLVIFWKPVEQFEKPILLYQTDEELIAKLQKIYRDENFKDVKLDVKDNVVTLSGSVPKEKLNELLRLVTAERTRGMRIAMNQ